MSKFRVVLKIVAVGSCVFFGMIYSETIRATGLFIVLAAVMVEAIELLVKHSDVISQILKRR